MDKSMEKIDIIKLLSFLLIFMLIAILSILLVIVPNIKEYRASKTIYKRAFVHQARVENVLRERDEELRDLNSKNRRVVISFLHQFSTDNFIKYAGKFFTQVTLEKVDKKVYKNDFIEYELKVTSSLKSPTNFYDFLEGLNRYDNIVEANFPIHLESNSSKINSTFTIKVYDVNSTK